MIDTHAHLDFPEFQKDREGVISRFFEQGGKAIVNIGVDLERSRKSVELAKKNEGIFASVGLHPDYFSGAEKDLRLKIYDLRKLAKHKKVVAVGETGLDYFYMQEFKKPDFSRGNPVSVAEIKENQKKGFLAQVEIAKELGLPVIVHCREAWEDLYEIIKNIQFSISPPTGDHPQGGNFQTNPNDQISKNKKIPDTRYPAEGETRQRRQIPDTKFVLHCYSGEKKDTEKFLRLSNVYYSFSGNITYPKPADRSERLAEAVRMIPLNRIMLDSDAPYLAPQELRGKRNEPANVCYIAKKIAEIKGISVAEVEKETDKNAQIFFGLK